MGGDDDDKISFVGNGSGMSDLGGEAGLSSIAVENENSFCEPCISVDGDWEYEQSGEAGGEGTGESSTGTEVNIADSDGTMLDSVWMRETSAYTRCTLRCKQQSHIC